MKQEPDRQQPSNPKYRRLIAWLSEEIRSGRFPAGGELLSEHELARQHNLSRHTVRQALGHLEREGYLDRRQGRATIVRFPPVTPGHQATPPKDIAVLIPCVTISLYPEVVRGVEDVVSGNGRHVVIGSYDVDPRKEKRYIAEMIAKPVAGMVICPSYNSQVLSYRQLVLHRMPFVLVDTAIDGLPADLVAADNLNGALEGTRLLLADGRRNIAFLSGWFSASTSRERLAGFRIALEERGLSLSQERVREGAFSEEFGYWATRELLGQSPRIDGMFVANDPITVGAIKAIQEAGLRVPEDIAVCTFDDPDVRLPADMSLIVVRQRRREAAQAAAKALFVRIEEKARGAAPAPSQIIRIAADVVGLPAVEAARAPSGGVPAGGGIREGVATSEIK